MAEPSFQQGDSLAPQRTGPLIGRADDVAALCRLFADGARLVTLVGPPGVGKTRLTVAAASAIGGHFSDGVRYVSLAAVRDPALVLPAIARALAIPVDPVSPSLSAADGSGAGGASPPPQNVSLAALRHGIGQRQLLLVLDNLEQVLGCALDVAALLGECPRLAVIATSRAPLRLAFEQEFPVAPLPVPDAGDREAAAIAASPAVQLFLQRARGVRPDFALTAENAGDVAALCRRVDGLPLALELAAARVRLLPPRAIAEQLGRRLTLLGGGPTDAPLRQQTVHAAITWSCDLLSPEDRAVFRRLGVFAGGCTLSAAAAVCVPSEDAPPNEGWLLGRLESLAAQSLLQSGVPDEPGETGAPGEVRFRQLELVREFALDRLAAEDDEVAARWRHAHFLLSLAEEAQGGLKTAAQPEWVRRLEPEHANFRAALSWLLERAHAGDAAAAHAGMRLAGSLWWFWHLREHTREGRDWLETFLDLPAVAAPAADRAHALFGAGFLAWSITLWDRDEAAHACASVRFQECLRVFEALGDRHGEAYARWGLGLALHWTSRAPGVSQAQEAQFRQSLELFRAAGDLWGITKACEQLGNTLRGRGERAAAQSIWEEGAEVARALGEPQGLAALLRQLGSFAIRDGNLARARDWLEESEAVLEGAGLRSPTTLTERALGELALASGNLEEAERRLRRSLEAAQVRGRRGYMGLAVMQLGAVCAAAGAWDQSLRLAGAGIGLLRPYGRALIPAALTAEKMDEIATGWGRAFPWLAAGRERVGAERATQLMLFGARAPLDEVVPREALVLPQPASDRHLSSSGKALADGSPGVPLTLPSPPPASAAMSELTPRERETAALIAAGLTNREIAARLTITERTVMRHVENILAKLGLRSRTQIAVWAVTRGAIAQAD